MQIILRDNTVIKTGASLNSVEAETDAEGKKQPTKFPKALARKKDHQVKRWC